MSHIKTTVNNIETLDGMISVDHVQLSTAQQTCLLCLPLFEGTIEKHKMTIFFASSLGDNDFTGEIPEAYTHLTNLSYLFANHFFQGITSIITEMQKTGICATTSSQETCHLTLQTYLLSVYCTLTRTFSQEQSHHHT